MATLCCCIEIALGIFAGCAPAIKPLVIALFVGIKSQTCSGKSELDYTSESIPSARPTRDRDPDTLASFTFVLPSTRLTSKPSTLPEAMLSRSLLHPGWLDTDKRSFFENVYRRYSTDAEPGYHDANV